MPSPLRLRHLVALSLALAACGGGGDGTSPDGTTTAGHRIRGTTSGLKGSGTTLQLNGGRDIAINPGAPEFFFTNVPNGTRYTITVKTQPDTPTQTCAVGNGTGTVSGDMDGVTLTCTTNTYAVRGTITGLTGAGLAMALNGGAPQAIPAGAATFAFPGIESESDFAVTIGAHPAGQTCALNNGSGRVTSADITNLTVSCGAQGFTIGGAVSGLGANGLTISMNGGPPLAIAGQAAAFTFPNAVATSTGYSVVTVDQPNGPPRGTCAVARGKGRVGTANVTDVFLQCRSNGLLSGYDGVYVVTIDGIRQYIAFWSSGLYSAAIRSDDPACGTNNGNGTEFGIYRRSADGTFLIASAAADRNGGCGLWDSQANPAVGLSGTLVRTGNSLVLSFEGQTVTLNAVESNDNSLVGAFTRADGVDGGFVVFHADGTYLQQEAQEGPTLQITAGYERGCYTVTGATFTTSLGTACRPNGQPAEDLNGRSGFSSTNGAPIPFTILSPTRITINGVELRRILPGG